MDFTKYENKKKLPLLEEEKAFKATLEGSIYKMTATGAEIVEKLKNVSEEVKKWRKKMQDAYQAENLRIYKTFKYDALQESGLADLFPEELQHKIFDLVYNRYHDDGLYMIMNELDIYYDLFNNYIITEKKELL